MRTAANEEIIGLLTGPGYDHICSLLINTPVTGYTVLATPILLNAGLTNVKSATPTPSAITRGIVKGNTTEHCNARGQIKTCIFDVNPCTLQGVFKITWSGGDYDLSLVRPDGSQIDPQDPFGDYTFRKDATYAYCAVDLPEPGTWTCVVTANEVPPGGGTVNCLLLVIEETPPEVILEGFADGYVLKEPVVVTARGYDMDGFSSLEFFLNYNDLVSVWYDTPQSVVEKTYLLNPTLLPDGKYTFSALLADNNFSSTGKSLDFIIDNVLPVADAGLDKEVYNGEEVAFDASSSSDAIVFLWGFGDGTVDACEFPYGVHTYSNPGRYTVTLTVYDDAGNMAEDTANVTVRARTQ
ncbi:MAG: PKD domain-containing protein [Bacillota bacterium]